MHVQSNPNFLCIADSLEYVQIEIKHIDNFKYTSKVTYQTLYPKIKRMLVEKIVDCSINARQNPSRSPCLFTNILQSLFYCHFRGSNVEDAFLETATRIYQSIQDGRLDLNAAESGVQHKPSQPGRNLTSDLHQKDNCPCQFDCNTYFLLHYLRYCTFFFHLS